MNCTGRLFSIILIIACGLYAAGAERVVFKGFERGMGIGGWLTNYKRFNVLPDKWRMKITVGDMEHFRSYITEEDVKNIADMGLDHIRLGFDQIVIEESPYKYREEIFDMILRFAEWCKKYKLNVIAIESGHTTTIEVMPDYRLNEGDVIVVIGKIDNMDRFEADM